MVFVLSILGVIAAIFMMKYRMRISDIMGEPDWMAVVGGANNFVVICAVLLIFWCIAAATGTTQILFSPILFILPGTHGGPPPGAGIVR